MTFKTFKKSPNKMRIFRLFFILMIFVSTSLESLNVDFLPGLPDEIYSQPGDINIASVVNILESSLSHTAETCSSESEKSTYPVESTEAVAFAVDLVNRDPNILPNVSLGYFIRATCLNALGVTLGTAISFLPRPSSDFNSSVCHLPNENSSYSSQEESGVIGMLGVGWSKHSILVSSLFAVGHIPIVGAIETSDELSNKRNHPYFFRVIPPDNYQVQAILKFIHTNGWSYISVIYEDGSYGQNSFDKLQKHSSRYGICTATSHRLISPPKYEDVVSDLLLNYRARVVVLFIEPATFKQILQAVHDKNATGHFVWIASDTMLGYVGYNYQGSNQDLAIGTFTFDIQAPYVPEFYDYLAQQRVSTTKNPWMKPVWEYLFNCSFDEGTCNSSVDILQSSEYYAFHETTLRIDAVLALARAAHKLLSARCPEARGQEVRHCIRGEMIKEYLKNTSFEGFNGHLEFDENQDMKGKYKIGQLYYDHYKYPFQTDKNIFAKKRLLRKLIGIYDIKTDTLTYSNESMMWTHLTYDTSLESKTDVLIDSAVPQSKCSSPCRFGEYKIEKELPCCWECRKCRNNERLIKDNTACEPCPEFTWPDEASGFTICKDIPLTYQKFNNPVSLIFTFLAIFALVITTFITVCYVIYRNKRVIKASSRELSIIQLIAISIGYSTVILFQTKPNNTICGVIFFLFSMSFALLYAPLFVKTMRIYRIFKSGSKNQMLRFISPQSQIIFAVALICVQGILCATIYILYRPSARQTQLIWSEKLVELSCDLTLPGMTSFLGYNIVLVSLCSVFAFMVRKLPDNFNESKFISMCVTTTLLIFLAFIPAYFTADREFVHRFLLSVALFLNHSVALIFLFLPKIYAAKFLPPETGDFSKNKS